MALTKPLASQIQQPADLALTDGSVVNWKFDVSPDAILTLGALAPGVTRTVANPTNLEKGEGSLKVDRGPGATGVIDAWGDKWWFIEGTAIAPSTIPGARDLYRTYCDGEYIYVTSAMRGVGVAGRGAVNPPAVIVPAPPPQAPVVTPVPTAQTLQAELLELGGALRVESTTSGYEGTGYVTFFDTDGDEGLFRFPAVVAGSYTLGFRYNRLPGAGSTTNWASINGGAEFEIVLPVTSGFGTFTIPGSYTLHDGTNTLKIRKKDGFFLLDSATITPVVAAPAPAPTPAPAPPAVVGGSGYPFGSRQQSIPNTHIKPNSVSNAQMDATIKSCYDRWKAALVQPANQIVSGGYIVRFSQNHMYVSEGIGMGAIIVVSMAGYDAQAKTIFDGFHKVARARTAYEISRPDGYHNNPAGNFLMNWRAGPNGEHEWNLGGGGGYSAHDGDLDFVYALLMAYKQWGDADYLTDARARINAMKSWFHYSDGRLRTRPTENMLRTSDVMLGHFQAFYNATGDSFWLTAKEVNLQKLEQYVAAYSNTYAIIPDALIHTDTSTPDPVDYTEFPTGVLDFTQTEGLMYANAQRNPWRLGTAYLYETDAGVRARLKSICDKFINFVKADTSGFPERTATGYAPNGSTPSPIIRPYTAGWYPWGMIGPQLPAAMVDSSHQAYLNSLWAFNRDYFKEEYYNAELQLIPMMVASGNWMAM